MGTAAWGSRRSRGGRGTWGRLWGLDLKSGRDIAEEEDTWARPSVWSLKDWIRANPVPAGGGWGGEQRPDLETVCGVRCSVHGRDVRGARRGLCPPPPTSPLSAPFLKARLITFLPEHSEVPGAHHLPLPAVCPCPLPRLAALHTPGLGQARVI